jgi:hypothetical protein
MTTRKKKAILLKAAEILDDENQPLTLSLLFILSVVIACIIAREMAGG